MPPRVDAGIHLGNLPAGINEEGMPRRELYYSQVGKRAINAAHLAVAIGQQLEVQSFFGAELFMRVYAVYIHAQHYRVALGILRLIRLKVVRFARAAGSLILGIKIEHHPAAAVILQADESAFLPG